MAQQLPRGQGLEAIVSHALHSFALIPDVKKATWYSPAAQAYVNGRPGYESLMEEVCELAGLTQHSKILEVGCGPGTATDRKSTRLNSSHITPSRMPSSA